MRLEDDILLRFLTKDKDRSHLNFSDEMAGRLAQFLSEAPNGEISIYSGYRSPERQAELYQGAIKKYGSPERARKWVAPPGQSRHNQGIAADLRFASSDAKRWAHANAARYGLRFRMGHEPWHVELASGATPETNEQIGQVADLSDSRMMIPAGITDPQFKSRGPAYERMIYNQQLADAPIQQQVLKKMGVV